MKRSVLKNLLLILVLTLSISLLVACDDKNPTPKDKYEAINNAFVNCDGINSVEYTLKVKAGEGEVYNEKTSYTVDGEEVSFISKVEKFNPDMWSDELISSEDSGTISLESLNGKLYKGLKLSDEFVENFLKTATEGGMLYTFELKDASIMLNLQKALTENAKVTIEVAGEKVNNLTIEYNYDGYSVESKYIVNY